MKLRSPASATQPAAADTIARHNLGPACVEPAVVLAFAVAITFPRAHRLVRSATAGRQPATAPGAAGRKNPRSPGTPRRSPFTAVSGPALRRLGPNGAAQQRDERLATQADFSRPRTASPRPRRRGASEATRITATALVPAAGGQTYRTRWARGDADAGWSRFSRARFQY